ncbi:MAG: DUF3090 domain-containing protein [Actinobacteria bacterium]|nr:DUF3090 domain-containing protein [Actinomycetota bacterium]
MILAELTDPFHVTAGYTGQAGDRTFYLQAEDEDHHVTVKLEKLQVDALAHVLVDLLATLDDEPATDWDRDAMALRLPVEPVWTVGEIRTAVDDRAQSIIVEVAELAPEDEEPEVVRVWLDRDLTRRLAAHAIEIVAEGRPRCHLCGRPEEEGGHVCPATNGHGRLSR